MTALLLVDIQNDFLPGGALAVPRGDEVIAPANRLQGRFDLVVATQDWHPENHGSFAANHRGKRAGDAIELAGLPQTLWPVHCVQGTRGAEFAADLDTRRIARVFRKGTDPAIDSYSGFFDNGRRQATGLDAFLRERGVRHIVVAGLATDYCVKATTLDAARLGYRVTLVRDACRGVELQPGDVAKALDEMRSAGVEIVEEAELADAVVRDVSDPAK